MSLRRFLTLLLVPAFPWQAALASSQPRLALAKLLLADEDVTDSRAEKDSDKDDDTRPATALDRARALGLSDDDNRPSKQRETRLLGKRLILGGEFNNSLRGRSHYDLKRGAKDDDLRFSPEIKLEAIWLPSESSVVFASAFAAAQHDLAREGGGKRSNGELALDNIWWLKTGLFGTPLAIQIGRQRLRDRREFWWDDTIDGVRLHYFGSKLSAYAGVGKPVGHVSTRGRMNPEEKGLLRAFGNLTWEWDKRQHVELFALHQDDQSHRYALGQIIARTNADDADAKLSWIGARARGCAKPGLVKRLCYWGDVAQVRGSERSYDLDRLNDSQQVVGGFDRTRIKGWAYDAGINLELPLSFHPVITAARARGSGDRPRTPGINGAFRQTGLHANDSKYRGLARFRSYGEVLRPDLSNIRVTTLALGMPLGKTRWIEMLWHRYKQPFADNRIAASPIGENPDGIKPRLGEEFDISLSHRPPTGWEFELTGGAFRAGPAFGAEQGRWARQVEAKIDYNF